MGAHTGKERENQTKGLQITAFTKRNGGVAALGWGHTLERSGKSQTKFYAFQTTASTKRNGGVATLGWGHTLDRSRKARYK